jgi:formamidopyrimidine-DNA glycosylase
MPELPELTVVAEVLNRRVLGQSIVSAEVIPPGGAIVVRDLTGDATLRPLAAYVSRWAYLMANY